MVGINIKSHCNSEHYLDDCRGAEERAKKIDGEKVLLERQVRDTRDSYQNLTTDLKLMTNERDQIKQEKKSLEVSLFSDFSLQMKS